MMMIQITNNSQAALNVGSQQILANGGVAYFPADRCSWEQSEVTGGYEIDDVHFYVGADLGPIDYANATAHVPTVSVHLTQPQFAARLGYIGKSGRFVAISV